MKNGNLIIDWVPYKHTVPEKLSLQSENYEIMWTSKILIFRFFSKFENAWKYILNLFSEAATGGFLQKRVFLEISHNSQETPVRESLF